MLLWRKLLNLTHLREGGFRKTAIRLFLQMLRSREVGEWTISLNNDYIPRLKINKTYKELITKGVLSSKEKEYVRNQMRAGKFLINSIDQRQNTIERITKQILEKQADFFDEGVSKLHPMTMSEVADIIEVHETTVSRAIANKFLSTPHGTFPFKFFFTPYTQVKMEIKSPIPA